MRGRVVTRAANEPSAPWVLLVHGHRGFMDWSFFPELADRIATAGITAVAFNLSGSGIGPDLAEFTDREGFAKNTYTQELEDIECVRAALDEGLLPDVGPGPGALFGHSRGGGMSLLHAAARGDYRALALWAPMHRVALFGAESRRSFRERGYILSPLAWSDPLRLDRDILDDAERNAERLDIAAACRRLDVPVQLVFGGRDRLLEAGAVETLEEHLRDSRTIVVEGVGHTLGARHPMRAVEPPLEQGLDATVRFLAQALLGAADDPRHEG